MPASLYAAAKLISEEAAVQCNENSQTVSLVSWCFGDLPLMAMISCHYFVIQESSAAGYLGISLMANLEVSNPEN